MKKWQVQEAKAKLSELIKDAVNRGPQEISVRGKSTAVVISKQQYIELTSPKTTFLKFLQDSPLRGVDLKIERDKSPCREVDF